eukprot:2724768-Rhodomonas_salina.1
MVLPGHHRESDPVDRIVSGLQPDLGPDPGVYRTADQPQAAPTPASAFVTRYRVLTLVIPLP